MITMPMSYQHQTRNLARCAKAPDSSYSSVVKLKTGLFTLS